MKVLQHFFNFEDPQAWNDITKDKKMGKNYYVFCIIIFKLPIPTASIGAKILKDTYGFDFVSFVPGSGKVWDPTKGWKNCLKGEYSKFARKCRKRGGVFKCCFSG